MKDPLQILLILDVAQVREDELTPLLDDGGQNPLVLRLSEESGRRPMPPGGMKGPYDWDILGRAVQSLAERARRAAEGAVATPTLYVAGRAPLPLFVQLGYMLPKFFPRTWILNPYRGGPWTKYLVQSDQEANLTKFFDVLKGLDVTDPVSASGWVAVYVSTIGAPAPQQTFLETLKSVDRSLAGTVEIRTGKAGDVTPENMAAVVNELSRELPRIKDTYPYAEGMALFVAGPVPLAFAVGRSLNFHAQRDMWIMNYDRDRANLGPGYEVGISLPFRPTGPPAVKDAPEDREARRDVLDAMIDGIEELRNTLQKEDFPPGDVASMPRRYLEFLKDLRVLREPEGDGFALSIAHRELRMGRGLLEALRAADRATLQRFAQLLVLHELYHDDQDLRSSNYAEIGRAGVVLEEVDFWADAFALGTLIAWDLRQGGPRAQAAAVAASWLDTAMFGIEAFDRFQQVKSIERLYERRLRRYLIWHLQHERATTIRSKDDARDLLADRLFVELAPLDGTLDPRGDKLVERADSNRTEIFVVRKGHLVRRGPSPGFEPSRLVSAVRNFDRQTIRNVFHVLIEEHRQVLVPWIAT